MVNIYTLSDPRSDVPVSKSIRYIGKTVKPIQRRLYEHFKERHHTHKRAWIQDLKAKGLRPGDGIGIVSLETRRKMSATHTGRPRPPTSIETRAKMSAMRKGRKPSPLCLLALSVSGRKPKSLETRSRMSAAAKLRRHTPETRAKLSAYFTAHPSVNLPGVIDKIRAANTGQRRTPEQCARISAAIKMAKRTRTNIPTKNVAMEFDFGMQ